MNKPSSNNRLASETSPYLLQHAHNPVDWYPWGPEALKRAKKENKPIFLSIGYSACHWCHVMERESFEDTATAKILNEHFISIKVDREERPDLDNIYMNAVQLMTHRGGWPMTVFLTPDLEPFYGGTYFPPEDRMGLPGFKKILMGVANTWKTRESEVKKSAGELLNALRDLAKTDPTLGNAPAFRALTEAAFHKTKSSFDPTYGGLGRAPKFFHTGDFRLALRHWRTSQDQDALTIVSTTLELWSRGGIYDQLGGGFHRYSTDDQWLVPHFEKMLYDNALLIELYVEAYQATHNLSFARTVREMVDYVFRSLYSPEGLFYSTEDADSEGVEGKFYIWSKEEIDKNLGSEIAAVFNKVFNVSENGNWEHQNILHRTESWEELAAQLNLSEAELEETLALAKRKLFSLRQKRIAPGIDTKCLSSWNGMMIHSIALAHQVLNEPSYLERAEKALNFILDNLWDGKTLKHVYSGSESKVEGFLEDYAHVIQAILTMYESNFNSKYIRLAEDLTRRMIELFWDSSTKQFFFSPPKQNDLVIRPSETYDGATPSSSAIAITALVRLGKLTYNESFSVIAEQALKTYEPQMRTLPQASSQLLIALELLQNRSQEFVLVPGNDQELEDWLQAIRERFIPNKIVAVKSPDETKNGLFTDKNTLENKTTLYLCENRTCQIPQNDLDAFKKALRIEAFQQKIQPV